MPVRKQLADLLDSVRLFSDASGILVISEIDRQSKLFLEWVPYLNSLKTGVADELLDGAVSSLREVAACSGLGLVRPALLAMRTEIDLILSWLYFKDHIVEWEFVNATGDGFKLKKEILDYLAKYCSEFGARYGILKDTMTRTEVDPYRLLSAHIHSQSLSTLPMIDELKDVVRGSDFVDDLPKLAHEVDEYISDTLFSLFASSWTQIPVPLISSLDSRFKSKIQKKTFFNGK